MGRIAVVSDDLDYTASIRALSDQLGAQILEVGGSGLENTTAATIMTQNPDAAVLGPGLTAEQRVSLTTDLDLSYPNVVVLWVVEQSPETWRDAMRAGARDLLAPGATDEAVVSQLREATGIVDARRDQAAVGYDEHDMQRVGRIVTVVSPKGGSGKTMISTNLAVGLAENCERGVVLVDLDLQFGDVTSALGLQAEYSVIDVTRAGGDATATKAFLTAHSPGLFVLPAPNNPAESEDADPEQIAKLLAMLQAEFSYVIVDTGAGIDEATLTAVEQATDVLFITTIDVAAIQALRKAVVVLDRLQLNQHRRWFVLNRANSRTGLSAAEIQDVTGLAIDAQIPSHRSISQSMNQGSPAIIEQRRTKVGKAFVSAAKLFRESEPAMASGARR